MKTILLVLTLTFPILSLAKGEISVRPYSLIEHGDSVLLKDIVDMQDVDPVVKNQLINLQLSSAPAPGEKLEALRG